MARITDHRQAGRAALLIGNFDEAFDELWFARLLEPELDRLGAHARLCLAPDWEIETDLTPLARALSSRSHPRAGDAWRRLLEDRPARSIQAEGAEWPCAKRLPGVMRVRGYASCTPPACSAGGRPLTPSMEPTNRPAWIRSAPSRSTWPPAASIRGRRGRLACATR